MPQANFGSADLVFTPPSTDADLTPVRCAELQEVTIDYDTSIKMLMGDKQFPIEAANGEGKCTGKAKFAKILARGVQRALAGSTIATGSKLKVVKQGTVASGSVTVTGSATYTDNLGVYDSAGIEYKQVAAGPTGLQYSVAAGVYTFNVSENGKVLTFRYLKSQVTGQTVTLGNPVMGIATKYKAFCFNTNTANAAKTLGAELFAVVLSKLSIPLKNTDFTIPDLQFECLADDTLGVGKIHLQE